VEQNFAKKFNAVISSSRNETKKRKRPTEQEIFTNKKEGCMHTLQNCLPLFCHSHYATLKAECQTDYELCCDKEHCRIIIHDYEPKKSLQLNNWVWTHKTKSDHAEI